MFRSTAFPSTFAKGTRSGGVDAFLSGAGRENRWVAEKGYRWAMASRIRPSSSSASPYAAQSPARWAATARS